MGIRHIKCVFILGTRFFFYVYSLSLPLVWKITIFNTFPIGLFLLMRCQSPGLVHAGSLAHCQGLLGHLKRTKPLLMLLVTPLLFQLWQVQMFAVKEAYWGFYPWSKVGNWLIVTLLGGICSTKAQYTCIIKVYWHNKGC